MYRVLYRKYRPQTFDDVIGQPHVTATLQQELASGRISHAYLFTGTRGTGKTSCARILSRAVNCLHPHDGNPCNECETCRHILDNTILDVIEIDAASNSGVDNIRDLREEANFTPVSAKYRVYIIDEVHMLTTSAFNALLKIMEEPPAHVVFILATTEAHKVPATILSRCQRFDFRRITPQNIAALLVEVAKAEGFVLKSDAALLIARIADGAVRDALSLLDRCLGKQEVIDIQTVNQAAGIVGRTHLFRLASAIVSGDASTALLQLDKLYQNSCDMEQLCSDLLYFFRDMMILKTAENASDILICTPEDYQQLSDLAKNLPVARVLHLLHVLEQCSMQIKRDTNKRIVLELALLRLCSPALDEDITALTARVAQLEMMMHAAQGNPVANVQKQENTQLPTKIQTVSEAEVAIDINAGTDSKADSPAETMKEVTMEVPKSTADTPPWETASASSDAAGEVSATETESTKVETDIAASDGSVIDETTPTPIDPPTTPPAAAEENNLPLPGQISLAGEADNASAINDSPRFSWDAVLEELVTTDVSLYGLLVNTDAILLTDGVQLQTDNESIQKMLLQPMHQSALEKALKKNGVPSGQFQFLSLQNKDPLAGLKTKLQGLQES